jgi:hypothetical protein
MNTEQLFRKLSSSTERDIFPIDLWRNKSWCDARIYWMLDIKSPRADRKENLASGWTMVSKLGPIGRMAWKEEVMVVNEPRECQNRPEWLSDKEWSNRSEIRSAWVDPVVFLMWDREITNLQDWLDNFSCIKWMQPEKTEGIQLSSLVLSDWANRFACPAWWREFLSNHA